MKILFLCGVFGKEHEAEVIAQARGGVEFSANLFQQRLIGGFRTLPHSFDVLSAPFIGAWPVSSRTLRFRGFTQNREGWTYVPFFNAWGVRNPGRASALKRAIRDFARDPEKDKLILVYCPHTPFLEAAVYAKKLDPRIRICLYVPDLPDYMNLAEKRSRVYDILKKYDIAAMHALMSRVDSFVLLTEPMKQMLPVEGKPCLIAEGLIPEDFAPAEGHSDADDLRYIVYTGKLNRKFGVADLLTGFEKLMDPRYRLVLCGRGDCDEAAAAAAQKDSRILVMGQLTPEAAAAWQRKAAVLVNPRPNNEDYTKYSFPSKNIEYLLSGKPVAACMLDGMPRDYESFIYPILPGDDGAQAVADALERALEAPREAQEKKYRAFLDYARENLRASSIAEAIVRMNRERP